jgi:class 3 adenylate cyclase
MANPEGERAGGEPSRSAEAWLADVREAERRGELLLAFDLADRGLDEHPGDVDLRYRAVLELARAGSTNEAKRRFAQVGLGSVASEDVAALGARIEKDIALSASGDERRRLAARAAAIYREISDRTRGYFPAINAATLSLLADNLSVAHALASDALDLVRASGDREYFAMATEAEAQLILGNEIEAKAALERAAVLNDGDYGAMSTTRRQLRLICLVTGTDLSVLSPLAGPAVAHFCGHVIAGPGKAGRVLSDQEEETAARMDEAVQNRPVGFAYGSLASGGDIMWAESLLAAGCELHVILPFALEEFVATSVSASGAQWVERLERCLEAATSVTYATTGAYLGDDILYNYCSELAMGLALLRARYLDADALQFALWDGKPPTSVSGTANDVAFWRKTGHEVIVVSPAGGGREQSTMRAIRQEADPGRPRRVVRAMLMGDIKDFSNLHEEQLPAFLSVVMGAFADVLARYAGDVEYRNTWGDAVFLVMSGVLPAARCALELQEAMSDLALDAAGLPPSLALRVSGHVGPTFRLRDPVLDKQSFTGTHVTRTARIEPVTPPGAVYVTEAFAAALEASNCDDLGCDYVGHLPTAKKYGRLRMYRIWSRRTRGNSRRQFGA